MAAKKRAASTSGKTPPNKKKRTAVQPEEQPQQKGTTAASPFPAHKRPSESECRVSGPIAILLWLDSTPPPDPASGVPATHLPFGSSARLLPAGSQGRARKTARLALCAAQRRDRREGREPLRVRRAPEAAAHSAGLAGARTRLS